MKEMKDKICLITMTKVSIITENFKTQIDNAKNATKHFDYAMIVHRLEELQLSKEPT